MVRLLSRIVMLAATMTLVSEMPVAADADALSGYHVSPITTMVDAFNSGDVAKLSGNFTNTPVIVDEFPPYSWSGTSATKDWFNGWFAFAQSIGLTDGHIVLGRQLTANSKNDRDYIVYAATFTAKIKGKPLTETGTWTFVTKCVSSSTAMTGGGGSRCSIDSQTWATTSMS